MTTFSIEYYSVKNKALQRSRHSKKGYETYPQPGKIIFKVKRTMARNVIIVSLKIIKYIQMHINFIKSSNYNRHIEMLNCSLPGAVI